MTSLRFVRWSLPCALAATLVCFSPASAQTSRKRPSPSPSPSATPKTNASAADALPEVVATVDGEPIKKNELNKVAETLVGTNGRTLQDLQPAERKQVYASVLDNMIVDKLLSKETANEPVADIDVEKRYNDLRSQYPTPQAFEEQVKKLGETTDKIRQNVRNQLAQQQFLEKQIADQVQVTPEEAEKFYKESPPNKFDEPEMIHAEHILVAVRKDAPPEDALKAEQRAQLLADRLKKGESFEEVARKQSDDPAAHDNPASPSKPATKGNNGDLDWFSRDRIMPEFGDVAFNLKKDEVSAPVRTQFGYHLIKLLDRRPAHTATFDEARDQIIAYLVTAKRQQAVAKVVADLRAKAKIETFLPTS